MKREDLNDMLWFLGGGRRAKLHQGRSKARDIAVDNQPHDQEA